MEDRHFTAFNVEGMTYCYTSLPMGIKSSGSFLTFLMQQVLGEYDEFASFYLDDIIIFSKTKEEHKNHVVKVLERLDGFGLTLSIKKCMFEAAEVEYLGHRISERGLAPIESRVEALKKIARPITIKDLRSFLGTLNFSRQYIPHLAQKIKLLTDLLKGAKSSRSRVKWNQEAQESFEESKEALIKAIPLSFPNPNGNYRLYTDASDVGVGGVLISFDNLTKENNIIGFFSKNFNASERMRSIFDRELLAILKTVKFFHVYIKFREFELYLDNKAL